jgi:hypothetical protein
VKGLNSDSEGVVTVDLILTVQKPERRARPDSAVALANRDTVSLIEESIKEMSAEEARNASHVYARVLRNAIQRHMAIDDLHLGDVLMALRNAGYSIDRKTGVLQSRMKRQNK